ncbi:MAG: hypothetical protein ABI353_17845 [Isosphaeraceae bacterium]
MSELRYINAPMTAADALDIQVDLGCLLQSHNSQGHPIPGTARVEVTPNSDGFDVTIPAEHAAQIVQVLKARIPLISRNPSESERN